MSPKRSLAPRFSLLPMSIDASDLSPVEIFIDITDILEMADLPDLSGCLVALDAI